MQSRQTIEWIPWGKSSHSMGRGACYFVSALVVCVYMYAYLYTSCFSPILAVFWGVGGGTHSELEISS